MPFHLRAPRGQFLAFAAQAVGLLRELASGVGGSGRGLRGGDRLGVDPRFAGRELSANLGNRPLPLDELLPESRDRVPVFVLGAVESVVLFAEPVGIRAKLLAGRFEIRAAGASKVVEFGEMPAEHFAGRAQPLDRELRLIVEFGAWRAEHRSRPKLARNAASSSRSVSQAARACARLLRSAATAAPTSFNRATCRASACSFSANPAAWRSTAAVRVSNSWRCAISSSSPVCRAISSRGGLPRVRSVRPRVAVPTRRAPWIDWRDRRRGGGAVPGEPAGLPPIATERPRVRGSPRDPPRAGDCKSSACVTRPLSIPACSANSAVRVSSSASRSWRRRASTASESR